MALLARFARTRIKHVAANRAPYRVVVRVHLQQVTALVGVRGGGRLLLVKFLALCLLGAHILADKPRQVGDAVLGVEVDECNSSILHCGSLVCISIREYRERVVGSERSRVRTLVTSGMKVTGREGAVVVEVYLRAALRNLE